MKEVSADYADERRLGFMEKLLDGVDVEWKTLGEVAILRRGRVISKS